MAVDVQGAEVARPWVERADATYKVVVDRENVLGELYGLKAVPIGILVDEEGRLATRPFPVNVADEEVRAALIRWATTDRLPKDVLRQPTAQDRDLDRLREAILRFRLGRVLLDRGEREEALAEWRKAWRLDPDNWMIRKQVWAIEHPERFYEADVDYDWQREQIEAGR